MSMQTSSPTYFLFPNQQLMPYFQTSQGKYYTIQQLKNHNLKPKPIKYNFREWKSKENKIIGAYCLQSNCDAKLIYFAQKQDLYYKLDAQKSQFKHKHQLNAELIQKQKSQKQKYRSFTEMYAKYFEKEIAQLLQKSNIQKINIELIIHKCLNQANKHQNNKFYKLLNSSKQQKESSYILIGNYIKQNNWKIIQNNEINCLKRQKCGQVQQTLTLQNKILVNKNNILQAQMDFITLYIKVNQSKTNSILKNYCLVYGLDQHSEVFLLSIAFVQSLNYHKFLYSLIQQVSFSKICFIIQQNPFLLGALKTIKNKKFSKQKQVQFLLNPLSTIRLIQSCKCEEQLKEQLKSLIYEREALTFDIKINFLRQVFSEDFISKSILKTVTQNENLMCFSKIKSFFIGNIFELKQNCVQIDYLSLILSEAKNLSELQIIILFLNCIKNNLRHFLFSQTSQNNFQITKNKDLLIKSNAIYEQVRYQLPLAQQKLAPQIYNLLFKQLQQAIQFKMEKLQYQMLKKKRVIRVKTQIKVFNVSFHQNQNQNCKKWHCQCEYYQKVGIPCGHQIRACLTFLHSIFNQIHPFWKPKINKKSSQKTIKTFEK